MTPAAFSSTLGCSLSSSFIKRFTAPACAIAKRFSCVSASDRSVPRLFSMAGTNVENSKTESKNGMPPAFLMVAFTESTTDKFHNALEAFSWRTSSVGLPILCMSAFTPPASAIAAAHSSSAARLVRAMDATALSVSGRLAFNSMTNLSMPLESLMVTLQASSTAIFKIAPAAANRASSGVPASKRLNSLSMPPNSRIFCLYSASFAKLPKHSADLPTMTISWWSRRSTRALTPSCLAISALLSSSTLRFLIAPAAARTQSSLAESSIRTRCAEPPKMRICSRFSRSRLRFSMQFAALSLVFSGPCVPLTRSTAFFRPPPSRIAV
mmetsp:Transcript_66408/g.138684  ORF Transcript_66408/g.138684 Transcript_66408/m.138684 type:complete len:325 (+) Transcript_66408:887-1861(+)